MSVRVACAVTGASTRGALYHPVTVASAVRLFRRGAVGKDGVRTKRHRLTFRLEHLAPVEAGAKTCTVRFSKVAARVKAGDGLTLAFGRYDRPTVLEAAAARVDRFDLTAQLEQMREIDAELDDLTAQEVADMDAAEEIMQGWTPADYRRFYLSDGVPAALLDALDDAGGDLNDVLLEAEARGLSVCTCLWFTLNKHQED